jgi:hypothetical protein
MATNGRQLRSELVYRHADVAENTPQRALGYVAIAVYWDRGAAPVRVAHDVVTSIDRATLKPCRSNARTTRMPETEGSGGIRRPR